MLWLMSYKAIHKTDNNRCIFQTDAITSLILQTKIKIMIKVILGEMQWTNLSSWLSSSNVQLPPICHCFVIVRSSLHFSGNFLKSKYGHWRLLTTNIKFKYDWYISPHYVKVMKQLQIQIYFFKSIYVHMHVCGD